jgi:hypothetical protein
MVPCTASLFTFLFVDCSCAFPCRKQPAEPPNRILPFLYLGSEESAMRAETLAPLRITHILNVTAEAKFWLSGVTPHHLQQRKEAERVAPSFTCVRVAVQDVPSEDLGSAWSMCIAFIGL